MGCPSVDIIVTELIMLGARRFVRVGTAGSLQPHAIRMFALLLLTFFFFSMRCTFGGHQHLLSLGTAGSTRMKGRPLMFQLNGWPSHVCLRICSSSCHCFTCVGCQAASLLMMSTRPYFSSLGGTSYSLHTRPAASYPSSLLCILSVYCVPASPFVRRGLAPCSSPTRTHPPHPTTTQATATL